MTPLARYRRHLRIQVLLAVAAFTVALQQFELLFILGAAAVASGYVSDGPRGALLTVLAMYVTGFIPGAGAPASTAWRPVQKRP